MLTCVWSLYVSCLATLLCLCDHQNRLAWIILPCECCLSYRRRSLCRPLAAYCLHCRQFNSAVFMCFTSFIQLICFQCVCTQVAVLVIFWCPCLAVFLMPCQHLRKTGSKVRKPLIAGHYCCHCCWDDFHRYCHHHCYCSIVLVLQYLSSVVL